MAKATGELVEVFARKAVSNAGTKTAGREVIEQWLTNDTIASCKNASISGSNQEWHDQRVMPYVGMTVKGWVWCESSLSAAAGRSPFS